MHVSVSDKEMYAQRYCSYSDRDSQTIRVFLANGHAEFGCIGSILYASVNFPNYQGILGALL